jgi:signal transduction histidine kinase
MAFWRQDMARHDPDSTPADPRTGIAEDASLQDQLRSLRRSNEHLLKQLEAGKAKDEFLAALSHELRTPLTSVLAWTCMLRGGKLDPGVVERGLEVIERNARMQSKLIDDLLDMSRVIAGKLRLDLRPVNPAALTRLALDALRPMAVRQHICLAAVIDEAADSVEISGDADRLQQVLSNLVTNAVKFTPRGGRVNVSVQRLPAHVAIRVSDNGRGIPADFLPHVFERFRQADDCHTHKECGLGLGLAIVKELVGLHGGEIHAASAGEGLGATFTVTLPLSPHWREQP